MKGGFAGGPEMAAPAPGGAADGNGVDAGQPASTTPRMNFPETWLWTDEITGY